MHYSDGETKVKTGHEVVAVSESAKHREGIVVGVHSNGKGSSCLITLVVFDEKKGNILVEVDSKDYNQKQSSPVTGIEVGA